MALRNRVILGRLLGGESMLEKDEVDVYFYKSTEGLEKYIGKDDLDYDLVVGYFLSESRLFVISYSDGTYFAENYYQTETLGWYPEIAYEWDERFNFDDNDERYKEELYLLQTLFGKVSNDLPDLAKDLFIRLIGGKDLASKKELSSEVYLYKGKEDLDYVLSLLKDSEAFDPKTEKLVGALVTKERILTVIHSNKNTNYKGSNGFIGNSYYKNDDGSWQHTEGYAWTSEYETSKHLGTILENVFGLPSFIKN